MKILLTGASGFIGSHLIKSLLNKNYTVVALARPETTFARIKTLLPQIEIEVFHNPRDIDSIFKKHDFDVVIHLATKYIKKDQSKDDLFEMERGNILYPSFVLANAVKYDVNFINTGTCFEYAPSKKKITENELCKPYNYYAATKLAFQELLAYSASKSNIKALTLRLFYPYGENDNPKAISKIVDSFISNDPIQMTTGGQTLNFTYIDDIVSAYLKSITFLTSSRYKSYEVFNIGSDKAVSIKEIVKMMEKIAKKKSTILLGSVPYSKDEIFYMNCNFTKAKRLLKWEPTYDIYNGLKKMYKNYKTHKL